MRLVFSLIVAVFSISSVYGQQPTAAADQQAEAQAMQDWQKAAGGHMEFEVASVRADTGEFKSPSFALSADDSFSDTGGLFHADFPLSVYVEFAYKVWLSPEQTRALTEKLPEWVSKDRFLIEARAEGHPTKDQFRLMMQSLLASRFGLKLHFETHETPVYEMVLIKPGKLGPNLKPHSEGPACDTKAPERKKGEPPRTEIYPWICGTYMLSPLPDHNTLLGSRDTTMELIASSIASLGRLGRPTVDHTGLTGRYDFRVEFSMEATRAQSSATEPQAEPTGLPLVQAAEEQLGVKLVPTRAMLTVPVIDAVERPSEN